MNVLVTGCAGFIGSNLTDRLLKEGYRVVGVDNFDPYYGRGIKERNIEEARKNKNFLFYATDVRKGEEMESIIKKHEINVVFHLAARAGVRASLANPFLYNDVNINGTLSLLETSSKLEVEKFVFASSSSVYGKYEYLPLEEKHPTNPISPYGISKLAAEKYCRLFDVLHGLKTVSLRIFTAYGPRQRPDEAIHKFTTLIFKGERVTIYGDGEQSRDFTYVDDIVEGFMLAMKKRAHGTEINLGSGKRITVNGLVELLEKHTKKRAKRTYINAQKGDVPATWASIEKAKETLGYEPKVGIDEGIKRFVEWFKRNQNRA